MTDEEKLAAIREYVENMWPIFRAAVFESPEREGYKRGFDEATHEVYQMLKPILDA